MTRWQKEMVRIFGKDNPWVRVHVLKLPPEPQPTHYVTASGKVKPFKKR